MSTYRAAPKVYFQGAIFFVSGVLIQVNTLYVALTGKGLPITSHGVTRSATPLEAVAMCVFPVLFWSLGLWWLLCASNFSVTTSEEGITITKFPGKVFKWRWEQIKHLSLVAPPNGRYGGRSGSTYYVIGDEKQTTSIYTVRNNGQFVDEIESHVGYLIG